MLGTHLTILLREGIVSEWYDRMIPAGTEVDRQIDENINNADIILLLISADFIASEYCYDIEMTRAIERHNLGEALVIPIILRPVSYTSSPFAKLLALPEDGKPVVSWESIDEAFLNITESIRNAAERFHDMLENTSSVNIEISRQWYLSLSCDCVEFKDKIQDKANVIASSMQNYAGSSKITLLGFTTVGKFVLLFESSKQILASLIHLHQGGDLSSGTDWAIEAIIETYGASFRTMVSANMEYTGKIEETKKEDLMLFPSKNYIPVLLQAIIIKNNDPRNMQFIINGGQSKLTGEELTNEHNKLIDYFKTSLAVKEENQYVNLSPYEYDKMLPEALADTQLGIDFLSFDCVLKRFVSSSLHPESEYGKKYWDSIYSKIFNLYGTTDVPINSFQKVWVVPEDATTFEKPVGESWPKEFPNENNIEDSDVCDFIISTKMEALCDEDHIMLNANYDSNLVNSKFLKKDVSEINKICTDTFKELILPIVKKEVNEGENFATLRQIYGAMILACWYKIRYASNPYVSHLIDTDDTSKLIPPLSIPLNKKIHEQYMKLFQDGIYTYKQRQFDPHLNKVINRVYFSGCLDFSCISSYTAHPSSQKINGAKGLVSRLE